MGEALKKQVKSSWMVVEKIQPSKGGVLNQCGNSDDTEK